MVSTRNQPCSVSDALPITTARLRKQSVGRCCPSNPYFTRYLAHFLPFVHCRDPRNTKHLRHMIRFRLHARSGVEGKGVWRWPG